MANWEKVVLGSGTSSQYIKGDGTFGTAVGLGSNTWASTQTIDETANHALVLTSLVNYKGIHLNGISSNRPAIKFENATQGVLGLIYGTEGNALVLATGTSGTTALTLDSSQNATFSGTISLPDGSASAPSLTNTGDAHTGLFFLADNTIAFSTGGTQRGYFSGSGNIEWANGDLSIGNIVASGDVTISHTDGDPTLYVINSSGSQNSKIHIGESNTTNYGQEIRWEGNLGNTFFDNRYNHATRPHMYFRMRVAGTPLTALTINPDATTLFGYNSTFSGSVTTTALIATTTGETNPIKVQSDGNCGISLNTTQTNGDELVIRNIVNGSTPMFQWRNQDTSTNLMQLDAINNRLVISG